MRFKTPSRAWAGGDGEARRGARAGRRALGGGPGGDVVTLADPRRRTPAEEARTLLAMAGGGTLATLSEDGGPWASLVAVAALGDGAPVLVVSTLAEHGRNLLRDPRASLVVVEPSAGEDALRHGRVTLSGRAEQPSGSEERRARDAFEAAVPSSAEYIAFGDFRIWVLRVERARWVGGFGRMATVTSDAYGAAEPDPVAPVARSAIEHLNADHAGALLEIARAIAGHTDARAATCAQIDRYGMDLEIDTPRERVVARVGFARPCTRRDGLREATVELARRARRG
jgi:putative heme iron utilization protein